MGNDKYNVPLGGKRYQSSLGRKEKEAYDDNRNNDSMVLATVTKINYRYNTVDLITIKRNESLVKSTLSGGRFSARLPVLFGGSWSGGQTYGQTIPINIGDTVLVGFIDGKVTSPIVINIYKTDVVAEELAPTLKTGGSPEEGDFYGDAFSFNTTFPSQTVDNVSGDGNIFRTLPGRTFLLSSTVHAGDADLNDTHLRFEDLAESHNLRGTLVDPINAVVPRILFQHGVNGITSNKKTIYFGDDGLFRLSSVLVDDEKRTYIEMNNTGDIQLRSRIGTIEPYTEPIEGVEPEDESHVKDSYIGILKGVPTISNEDYSVEVKDGSLYVNGQSLEDLLLGYTEEIEAVVAQLVQTVQEVVEVVGQLDIEKLKEMQDMVIELGNTVEGIIVFQEEAMRIAVKADATITEFLKPNGVYDTLSKYVQQQVPELLKRVGVLEGLMLDAKGSADSIDDRFKRIERDVELLVAEFLAYKTATDTRLDKLEEVQTEYFVVLMNGELSQDVVFNRPFKITPAVVIGSSNTKGLPVNPIGYTLTIQGNLVTGLKLVTSNINTDTISIIVAGQR